MEVMGAGEKVSGGSEVKDTEVWSCTLVCCTFPFVDIYPHLSMHAAGEWKGTHPGDSPQHKPHASWLQNRKGYVGPSGPFPPLPGLPSPPCTSDTSPEGNERSV